MGYPEDALGSTIFTVREGKVGVPRPGIARVHAFHLEPYPVAVEPLRCRVLIVPVDEPLYIFCNRLPYKEGA
jgi:hypothetical protein